MRFIYFICISSVLLSCNQDKKSKNRLDDFLNADKTITTSLSEIPNDDFVTHFDTVPIEFGRIIFDDILKSLEDTNEFKEVWFRSYQVTDSIENVLALKTNNYLDPDKQLTKNSYFLIVILRETSEIAIAATIFVDLDKDYIGTFIKTDSLDSFYFEHLTTVHNLKEKLKI